MEAQPPRWVLGMASFGFRTGMTLLLGATLYPPLGEVLAGDLLWRWIERVSWLCAFAGVGFAVWIGVHQLDDLRRQQRRIADDLERRPHSVFNSSESTLAKIPP